MTLNMNEAREYKPSHDKIKDLKNEVAELQCQLAETKAALADLLHQIEACDGTAQLNIECAQKLINEDLK